MQQPGANATFRLGPARPTPTTINNATGTGDTGTDRSTGLFVVVSRPIDNHAANTLDATPYTVEVALYSQQSTAPGGHQLQLWS